ncbi:MAG: transposase [Candidatus Marsarchaeota archaeon]|jgi:putative transposase|nr:transposase [Candidatus Marsarchaeota archaeon]MCL5418551.1 transposase [Candidatus Marsarchaeota archaeon]
MECIRAYKFAVYPDEKRRKEIDNMLVLAQRLYNKILEKTREEYKKSTNSKVNLSTLNMYMNEAIKENKEFSKLYSQTRQDIFVRLQRAFQNFFRRVNKSKHGKKVKVGFPRFKPIDRYKSLKYPQNNGSFSIEKKRKTIMLRVSKIGRMKIDLHRQIGGDIKTLTIKREAGQYYAIFTAIEHISLPKIEDTNPIGIDLGLNNFIALSDGTKVEKPKFAMKREKRIARWQRKIARRQMKSKRRQKAKQVLEKEWKYATNQSEDFAHKLSSELVHSGATSFAAEKLNIQNMAKNHRLAQSIYNASWNKFIQMLSYKAESAGMKVILVDPRGTTQECSNCHHVKKGSEMLTLEDRIYHCNACGFTIDRDQNAAINIRNRSRAGLARSYAQGDDCLCASTGSASSVGELRTYSASAGEAPTFR